MTSLDSELLGLLICPLSKADLVLHEGELISTDKPTRRAYKIVQGIPDLLIDHSRELELDDWEKAMKASGRS